MGTKSKLFRVFVEGETISDGRKVTAEMIDECVETFAPKTYSPRVNIEHIAGFSPEPPFNGYGDVIALEAKTDDFAIAGKTDKRRALYAIVDGNDQLVTLAKADQKPFPSVELTPNYAGSGKFGIIGLAFTDTPASIGTERLQFSHRAPGTVFASAADAVTIEFEGKQADATSVADAIVAGFSRVAAIFKPTPPEPKKEESKEPANDNDRFASAIASLGTTIAASIKPIADAQVAADQRFAALEQRLASTEQPRFDRQRSTGGGDEIVTDC
jgi:hypothetical protein